MRIIHCCRYVCLIVFFTVCAATAVHAIDIPAVPPPETLPDPADLVSWPLAAYPVFAADSAGNAHTWLADGPAGKHGYLKVLPDGQTVFADGTPARFWGTTTAYASSFPDKPSDAVKYADYIAACGYNIVRFHHNDMQRAGLGYLQPGADNNYELSPEGMKRLDFFAAELMKRGVYIYLDCVDFRQFTPDDGFDDWKELNKKNYGWKGVFPHPKIVRAWKQFVTSMLSHTNVYTGRTWGEEPGIATIEIINENGPFWDWSFQVTEPVLRWYDEDWNRWLVSVYGTREKLDAQWTDHAGTKGLFPDEDPVKGSVYRPKMMPLLEWDRPYASKTRGAARVNDYYRYLSEISGGFYKEAMEHIRGLGYRNLIVGSHELQGPMNIATERVTGVLNAHLYTGKNISWDARPGISGVTVEGVDVKTKNWFANTLRIKTQGCPGINGEWTTSSLVYRADGNIAVAAASAFQRVTQSLQFTIGHRWVGEPMPAMDTLYKFQAYRNGIYFNYSSDHEVSWQTVNRIAAPLFIRGDFARSKHRVQVAYSAEDVHEQNLHALGLSGGSGTVGGGALFLPMLHEVETKFFDTVYDGDADVVFTSGRTASGDYSRAKHAFIIGDNPFCDRYHKKRDIGFPARKVHPAVRITNLTAPVNFTAEWPWSGARTLAFERLEGAVEIASLPKGAMPIGKSGDGIYTLGWLDGRFLVIPNAAAFGRASGDVQWLFRAYLAACKKWGIDTADNAADASFYMSDTRELVIDWAFGTTVIDTERTQGFSGFIGWRPENRTRDLMCITEHPYANVLATSLDGLALARSKRMLVVAVGRMQNTGQEIGITKDGSFSVTKTGNAPCLVEVVSGTLSIANSNAALTVHALDHEGRRIGSVPCRADGGGIQFDLRPAWGTVWYEVASADVAATAAPASNWPREVKARAALPRPQMMPLASWYENLNGAAVKPKTVSAGGEISASPTARMTVKRIADDARIISYGNVKTSVIKEEAAGTVLSVQFGKVDQQWYGGFSSPFTPLAEKKPGAGAVSIGFTFKGDGSMPREAYAYVKMGGMAYITANMNRIFENATWKEIVLSSNDFKIEPGEAKKKPAESALWPAKPDLAAMNQFAFVCVGPLMDARSVGCFGEVFMNIRDGGGEAAVDPFKVKVAPPAVPPSRNIVIPYRDAAEIKADGIIDETVWGEALAIKMDETEVPKWQFFSTHVVEGKRIAEKANFWLLSCEKGLCIIADVTTGGRDAVGERPDWYMGDCVEIFTDCANTGGKPSRQIFLAYRRPTGDRAAASDAGILIGRARTAGGYLLEALVPWKALGFTAIPAGEFGIDLQVDFGQPGAGRSLQMGYATGVNEAWFKSEYYLKATLGTPK